MTTSKRVLTAKMVDLHNQLTQAQSDRRPWKNKCLKCEEKGRRVAQDLSEVIQSLQKLQVSYDTLDQELWDMKAMVV